MKDKHIHKWKVESDRDEGFYLVCDGCPEELKIIHDGEYICRRLNAAECLPSGQVRVLNSILLVEFGEKRSSGFREYLTSYIHALEGKE